MCVVCASVSMCAISVLCTHVCVCVCVCVCVRVLVQLHTSNTAVTRKDSAVSEKRMI